MLESFVGLQESLKQILEKCKNTEITDLKSAEDAMQPKIRLWLMNYFEHYSNTEGAELTEKEANAKREIGKFIKSKVSQESSITDEENHSVLVKIRDQECKIIFGWHPETWVNELKEHANELKKQAEQLKNEGWDIVEAHQEDLPSDLSGQGSQINLGTDLQA